MWLVDGIQVEPAHCLLVDLRALVTFLLVAAILTVTPGADMALVAHTTLARGRRAAFLASSGVCAGLAVHALASSVGLSSLFARSATAYAIENGRRMLSHLGSRASAPSSGCSGPDRTPGGAR